MICIRILRKKSFMSHIHRLVIRITTFPLTAVYFQYSLAMQPRLMSDLRYGNFSLLSARIISRYHWPSVVTGSTYVYVQPIINQKCTNCSICAKHMQNFWPCHSLNNAEVLTVSQRTKYYDFKCTRGCVWAICKYCTISYKWLERLWIVVFLERISWN